MLGQTLEWVELPDDLVSRLEGKSSLGRLGLLIHSTAGYVDPGWKGNLTLELSNVANLPIALYYGMRIGQISFFRMQLAGRAAVREQGAGLEVPGPVRADGVRVPRRLRPWAQGPHGGGGRVTGTERRRRLAHRPRRRRPASPWSRPGTFRTDAGAIFGPVPWILWRAWARASSTSSRRLLQALNCLLIETPAGRVLVETGIGERLDDKTTAMREYRGPPVVPAMRAAGFDPGTVDIVAMSHLHFDHAGGLLLADGSRAFPRARIVAQRAEWEVALGGNSRLVASYDQPELRLVADWGAEGWAEGDASSCRACPSCARAATRPGTRRSSSGGPGRVRGRWPSSATCACGHGRQTRAG